MLGHTGVECIFTLLLRRVNAVSQPPLWLEGLLLISQPI